MGIRVGKVGAALLPVAIFAGILKQVSPNLFSVDLTLVVTALLVLLAIVRVLAEFYIPWSLPAVLVMFISLGLGLVNAPLSGQAIDKSGRFFVLTLACTLASAALVREAATVRVFVLGLFAFTTAITLIALLSGQSSSSATRLSIGETPIATGRAAALCVVLSVGLGIVRRLRGIVWLPTAALAAFVCLASGSRGPTVALVLACATTLLLLGSNVRRHRAVAAFAVAVGAAIVVIGLTPAPAIQRFAILLSGDEGTSGSVRVALEQAAVTNIGMNPWTGIGWGNFGSYVSGLLGGPDRRTYVHNILLEVALEAGVIALAVFTGYLAAAFVRLWRERRDVYVALTFSTFVFFLAAAMFSGDVNDNRGVFVCLGIGIGLVRTITPSTSPSARIREPATT